jgi:DNA-damage-inducible protein D
MSSEDNMPVPSDVTGKGVIIGKLLTDFEGAAHADEDGVQYWFARDIAPMLGYLRWENFSSAIERAKLACQNSGEVAADHFRNVTKMVALGSRAARPIEDTELTRFACYLIAMSGDPNKPEIAAAQTYFAVQTRRQEVADMSASERPALTEDERRILLRDEMKEHNKSLASAAKKAGVATPVEYAVFKNAGYKGLYGGLDRVGIQRRKKLTTKQDILDHMPSGELAANLFVATQTEDKLRREEIAGKSAANRTHFDVGSKVRQTIKDIGGTMPEQYPAAENVKEARKRVKETDKAALAIEAPAKVKKK